MKNKALWGWVGSSGLWGGNGIGLGCFRSKTVWRHLAAACGVPEVRGPQQVWRFWVYGRNVGLCAGRSAIARVKPLGPSWGIKTLKIRPALHVWWRKPNQFGVLSNRRLWWKLHGASATCGLGRTSEAVLLQAGVARHGAV